MSSMYRANSDVATTIAQICCLDNALPQGAPTSPVISNMICAKMDAELKALARTHRCTYTRYSDDITISSSHKSYPTAIAAIDRIENKRTVVLGEQLRGIINKNGFEINEDKTRLLTPADRQEVTGLVTNRFVNVPRTYIRAIRGALHAWRVHGPEAAASRFNAVFDHRTRDMSDFQSVIFGRIQHVGTVRGYDDQIYRKLRRTYNQLSPLKIPLHETTWDFRVENAVWVIESGETLEELSQGTAFFLNGIGIVTCAHCLGPKPNYIYHPSDPTAHYNVEIVAVSEDVDLAVLRTVEAQLQPLAELAKSNDSEFVERGDDVTLAGWPSYGPGSQLSVKQGKVQSIKMRSGIRRFNISTPIIEGNSGGPVFNLRGQVIGVAATGAANADDEGKTEAHGVIPIAALQSLSSAER
jgi:RNA-directed DNA polymerase